MLRAYYVLALTCVIVSNVHKSQDQPSNATLISRTGKPSL